MRVTEKNRKDFIALFLLLVFVCIFFSKVLFNPGKMLHSRSSDMIAFTSPYKLFIHRHFQDVGSIPLWNPFTFSGNPIVADIEMSMFYPPDLLFLVGETYTVYAILMIFHFILGCVSMYLLMRVYGLDETSSIFSSLVYVFSGSMISRIYLGHFIILNSVLLVPLIFLLFELSIRKSSLGYGLLAGLAVGMQLLAGHPQFFFYTIYALLFYILARYIALYKKNRRIQPLGKSFRIFLLAFLVAISTCAIQLIPVLEITQYFIRSGGVGYVDYTQYSFPLRNLVTLIVPEFYGTRLKNNYWGDLLAWDQKFLPMCAYTGILSLGLALFGLYYRRNIYTVFFGLLALSSLLFAFGRYLPFYYIGYHLIPGFKMFRGISRILFLFNFSIAILAGFGLNYIAHMIRPPEEKKLKRLMLFLSSVFFALLLSTTLVTISSSYFKEESLALLDNIIKNFFSVKHDVSWYFERYFVDYVLNSLKEIYVFLFFLGSSILLLFSRFSGKLSARQFKAIALLVILVDLWFFGVKYVNVIDPKKLTSETDLIRFLKMDGSRYRIVSLGEEEGPLPYYLTIRYNIENAGGVAGSQLRYYREFIERIGGLYEPKNTVYLELLEIKNPQLLDLLNIKYVLSTDELSDSHFKLVYSTENDLSLHKLLRWFPNESKSYVYENLGVLPRAFIVGGAKVVDREMVLDELVSEHFDPRKEVILEGGVESSVLAGSMGFQEAQIISYSPDEIQVDVNISRPGFLVLSEIYYPGWRAYDNGVEKKIYRANYIFRAVYLGEGEHRVVFKFGPKSVMIGAIISIISFLLVAVYLLFRLQNKYRGNGKKP